MPGTSLLDDDLTCFEGDMGDMTMAARRVAIHLKQGRAIMGGDDTGRYATLLAYREDVERSLNNDLLCLYLDESNEVAWAECPEGLTVSPLLVKSCLRYNDASIFVAIALILLELRQAGIEAEDGWYATFDELASRYQVVNSTSAVDTRGQKVNQEIDKALRTAKDSQWVRELPDGRWQIMPTVASLVDRGFVEEIINKLLEPSGMVTGPDEEAYLNEGH